MNEDIEEHIGCLAEMNKISQSDAEKMYEKELAAGVWEARIEFARQKQREQLARKRTRDWVDRKIIASGEK